MMEQALGGMGGMGGMPMQMPQIAPGYTPPMGQAAMAKARLMGYSPRRWASRWTATRIKDRRKRERQARKKNRKRR